VPRLTDLSLRSISPNTTIWDSDLPGFGVRAGKAAKTFVVLVGSGRRFKLGRYPLLSLAKAREKAKDKLADVQLGNDHKPIPFKELKRRFLEQAEANTRPRTYDSYKWLLDRVELRGDANTISTRTLTDAVANLAPSVRTHLLAVYKLVFRYGVAEGLIKTNPADALTIKKAKPRKRFLITEEIRQVWRACPDNPFGTTVKILLLTGQRRTEVQHFILNDDLVTIPGEFVKNHRDHTFPVCGITKELIEADRSWGGWSKSKAQLDEEIDAERDDPIDPWTLHDLRRTFRTTWASLRLPREVAEKYINHVSGVQTAVEQIYDQHDYIDEMRECIKIYTDHIIKVVT